jgi:hypothetical protein
VGQPHDRAERALAARPRGADRLRRLRVDRRDGGEELFELLVGGARRGIDRGRVEEARVQREK